MAASNALSIQNLTVGIGGKTIFDDVSFTVPAGEIVALLGPNGAGKSELVLAIAGVIPKLSGTIMLGDRRMENLSAQRIRSLGVAAVPEGHQVLPRLTVDENLRAAGSMKTSASLVRAVDEAYAEFPELRQLAKRPAGLLSGGQQQMVAIAQALVCEPRFLLIDEMSLGLAPVIIERLTEAVRKFKAKGMGILLIEQFTHLALALADRSVVLSGGRVVFCGSPERLRSEPQILQKAYLG